MYNLFFVAWSFNVPMQTMDIVILLTIYLVFLLSIQYITYLTDFPIDIILLNI